MASIPRSSADNYKYPKLNNGDCMRRDEFHAAYLQMPTDYRAELIGGIVFEPSPLGWPHGANHATLIWLLKTYSKGTPGVEIGDNASVFLSDDDEVQPDITLRRSEKCGGLSKITADGYVTGPPELVVEIANSSRAIDLHLKKEVYARSGVLEYIVLCLHPQKIYWFDLQHEKSLSPDSDGIYRSRVFPGLWIHESGLLQSDDKLTDEVLFRGLESSEHSEFAKSLIIEPN
jgi:Uma2 family endonuclease